MKDCRKAFTQELLAIARKDRDIVAVTTDARGSVTLSDFASELPAQFVECGIAEQNAVGISAGLAHSGKKVYCCGPACFYVARSLEQVKVDLAYSHIPVTIVGVSGGFAYGALGATHHSMHDIAVLRCFPGMSIFLPSDAAVTARLTDLLADYPHPAYVRVGRGAVPEIYDPAKLDFNIGKAIVAREGTDVTIAATGESVAPALEAAKLLEVKGINAAVLDYSCIVPFDSETLRKYAARSGRVVTVEQHSRWGGLGSIIAGELSETDAKVRILGVPDENAPHGSSAEISHYFGLDAEGIAASTSEFLNK